MPTAGVRMLAALALLLASTTAAAVQVTVARTAAWNGGYNGELRIRNDGAAAVSGWQLGFSAAVPWGSFR